MWKLKVETSSGNCCKKLAPLRPTVYVYYCDEVTTIKLKDIITTCKIKVKKEEFLKSLQGKKMQMVSYLCNKKIRTI